MGSRLRVAGIGGGYFSRFHLEGWKGIEDVDLVAWCDVDAAKAAAVAERFGTRSYTDAATMLDETSPHLVDIVTPPPTHRALVALTAARSIPTICQKALAPTYDEAVAIVELADSAGIPFVVHENFRWQPWYREARRLIEWALAQCGAFSDGPSMCAELEQLEQWLETLKIPPSLADFARPVPPVPRLAA